MANFAERIKERREACELTQDQLAEKLGISREAISQWESGETTPRHKRLREIAAQVKCSVSYLTGGKDVPMPDEKLLKKYHSLKAEDRNYIDGLIDRLIGAEEDGPEEDGADGADNGAS